MDSGLADTNLGFTRDWQWKRRKSGKPDLRCPRPGMTAGLHAPRRYAPPGERKDGARSLAAANTPLASTEVIATVVRRSVTPPLLPAAISTAAICVSLGASAITRKSYSPKVR